jgi:hypothetical protein
MTLMFLLLQTKSLLPVHQVTFPQPWGLVTCPKVAYEIGKNIGARSLVLDLPEPEAVILPKLLNKKAMIKPCLLKF